MNIKLIIDHKGILYAPAVEDGIQWELERKGVPGKLTFKVLKDGIIDFTEGDHVVLKVDGVPLFYGFVFQKRRDKERIISVTAYDQLRYLKNKDIFVYENKTATEVVQMLAEDFKLQCGELEDTGFKIESRTEENKTLFDVIQTALDLTLQNKGEMYVLYDDFGKLTLKNIGSLKLDILINSETSENFDYTSSIDGETYDKIHLVYEDQEAGRRQHYFAQDGNNINKWGVLQYFEKIDERTNGQAKADALLKLHNRKTRNLTVKNAFGDIRVRGGSIVPIALNLGDIITNSYFLVEKVKHNFSESHHTMDLTLRGGGFDA